VWRVLSTSKKFWRTDKSSSQLQNDEIVGAVVTKSDRMLTMRTTAGVIRTLTSVTRCQLSELCHRSYVCRLFLCSKKSKNFKLILALCCPWVGADFRFYVTFWLLEIFCFSKSLVSCCALKAVFTTWCHAERSIAVAVFPSVTLRYRDHIGWNASKIISRLISLGCSLSLDHNITDLTPSGSFWNSTWNRDRVDNMWHRVVTYL